jgi:glycine/D-amino acid oxidase-like deaminating enzyme
MRPTAEAFDAVIAGGGIMGAAAALRLAEAGMRVALLEAALLGTGASGVNAGTLSLQIKRVALMPYAIRGRETWKLAGDRVGFREIGGITLAFTESEAAILSERMTARRDAGAPIELVTSARAREIEPGITERTVLASYCPLDGYANASVTGMYYRQLLQRAGVHVLERTPVDAIEPDGAIAIVRTARETYAARRVLLATGAWTKVMSERLGHPLPVAVRINTVSVTERASKLLSRVIGHATGLLTMKQSGNGTILIGGGWQGRGTPGTGRGEVLSETLVSNLRLAQYAVPGLAKCRLLRSWTGFEAHAPDSLPLAGLLPGTQNIYVLCCVRGGYTIGPYIGKLMGDLMLGEQPEMPLFDPARFVPASVPRG